MEQARAAATASPCCLRTTNCREIGRRRRRKKSPCKSFLETRCIATSENPVLRNTAAQFSEFQHRTVPTRSARGVAQRHALTSGQPCAFVVLRRGRDVSNDSGDHQYCWTYTFQSTWFASSLAWFVLGPPRRIGAVVRSKCKVSWPSYKYCGEYETWALPRRCHCCLEGCLLPLPKVKKIVLLINMTSNR